MEYNATPSTVLSLRLWRRIGNHYFACWCSVKGQPGIYRLGGKLATQIGDVSFGGTDVSFLTLNRNLNATTMSFYCCTPITVLAVCLSRWRQNATLPSIIVYWRSLHFIPYVTMIGHWDRKFNDSVHVPFTRNFATKDLLANRNLCVLSSVEVIHKKPCAIGKDLTVFIKKIGVSRYIGNPARFNFLYPSYLSST